MKKIMYVLVSGTLMLTTANFANAQDGSFAVNTRTSLILSGGSNGATTVNASEVSAIVLKDFTKKYKSVSDVTWMTNGLTTSAYFSKDNIKMRSTYDVNGKWEYTLSYLPVTKLPLNVRNQVQDEYGYMNIIQVIQVERRDGKVHFVKMEDRKSFTTVICADGNMEVYEFVENM